MKSLLPFLISALYLVNAETQASADKGKKDGAGSQYTITKASVNGTASLLTGAPVAEQVIYASKYGFSPRASAATNTKALQRISAQVNSMGGGVRVVIDKGTYRVGTEKQSRTTGKGFAYIGDPMLTISNTTKPVVIDGKGATIKLADGLHLGSFHPVTGRLHNAKAGGFYERDYMSYPGNLIDLKNNKSVTIRNINLDGNIPNLVLGGYWGDVGRQLPADGIFGMDNNELLVENVTSRHFGRDGIHIGNAVAKEGEALKKITIINSTFDGNARQGFSWIGGNHLVATNARFINTGKTVNRGTGQAFSSAPSAGVDMEAEVGIIRNGVFENCLIDNNTGAGLLSVGNVADIKVVGGKTVGATSWSIYGSGPRMMFINHTVVGAGVNLYLSKEVDDPNRTKFVNSLLTLDPKHSPTGKVYGGYVMDLGGGGSPTFINCTLDAANRSNVYGGNCVFENCTFTQSAPTEKGYNGYSFMVGGTYKGTNRMTYPGGIPDNPNKSNSTFLGSFIINGVDITKRK